MYMLTCRAEAGDIKLLRIICFSVVITNIIEYENWSEIQWKSVEILVYDLQRKIYYHAGNNNIGLIRHYQHKLVKSSKACLLSVRLVSPDNRGKATAKIEGVSKLSKSQKLNISKS